MLAPLAAQTTAIATELERALARRIAGEYQRRERGHRRSLEELRHGHLQAELAVHVSNHLHAGQRIAADLEEVVVPADWRHAEHALPHGGDARLEVVTRS